MRAFFFVLLICVVFDDLCVSTFFCLFERLLILICVMMFFVGCTQTFHVMYLFMLFVFVSHV